MGCVFGKPSGAAKERVKGEKKASSKSKESLRVKESEKSNSSSRNVLIDRKCSGSRRVRDDNSKQIKESEVIVNVPKAMEGELVAAGWPSWLSKVAGEAIIGWLPRKADTFEKLDKIGQGTYSNVYRAHDLTNNKVVAIKRVKFDNNDPESVKFMAREILILRKLDHPNVIKLEGMITSSTSCSLYLVFEYMEHDLMGLASLPGVKFSEPQIKCYMQQLLSGLDHCHSRGVLHRDIKGSNLLIDNEGILKIADFGLATFFYLQQSVALTSRVVTLWYRPPELLLGATHYGVAVDLWSAGCILGELYTGKPIMPGRTEVEQLHKIFKICGSPSEDYWRESKLPHSRVFRPIMPYKRRITEAFKDLTPAAVGLMDTLLSIDPAQRGSAARALKSDLFTTKPLACDPSSLPKYPPSKEIDVKLREEEARRQGAPGAKEQITDTCLKGGSKESRGFLSPNSKLSRPMQILQQKSSNKSIGEELNENKEATQAVGETVKNHRGNVSDRFSHSGPRIGGKKYDDDISIGSIRADPKLSGLSRIESRKDRSKELDSLGNKVNFSGPLLAQPNRVDQLLKEHERRIQEAARRSRIEKARLDTAHAQGKKTASSIYISSLGRRR